MEEAAGSGLFEMKSDYKKSNVVSLFSACIYFGIKNQLSISMWHIIKKYSFSPPTIPNQLYKIPKTFLGPQ